MACYHPIDAWYSKELNPSGKRSIVFKKPDSWPGLKAEFQVPCGQCIGCRLEYSRQWAMRIVHESQLHKDSSFITLTYDDENLPNDCSLDKRHLQLFFKKLRKAVAPQRIRYFAAGEYGEQYERPHYHACVFGYMPSDGVCIRNTGDYKLYSSRSLEQIWSKGLVSFGTLTFESAAYTARYVTKKITGDQSEEAYRRVDPVTGEIVQLVPEFALMSRRPGIGKGWYDKFRSDCYPSDEVVCRGKVMQPPKFYDKNYEEEEPDKFERIKEARILGAKKHKENNTRERLSVREKVTLAKQKLKTKRL